MKQFYTIFYILFFITTVTLAQEEVIYEAVDNGSGVALGVPFTTADNGPNTFTGDAIEVAGTARIITEITVACFVETDTSFIPDDFTVRLYTSCPTDGVGATGLCGANGAGSLIPGSEVTIKLEAPPTTANPVVIDMPNVDISSETDDTIWVVFNSTRTNIIGALNGVPTTGMDGLEDPTHANSFTSCGTNDASNCNRRILGAANNNFVIRMTATEALGLNSSNLDDAISIFPNPINDVATVAFQDSVNPKQAHIYDINGKLVAHKYTYNLENNFKMNMSSLKSGIYFLHFEAEEGTVVKQLVKL